MRLPSSSSGDGPCVVLTGAGISTESGVPDFRSASGIWAGIDPYEVASIEAFRRDPARVWQFYARRLGALHDAEPNDGHRALAELEHRGLVRAIVTQNVDSLHTRAGSEDVIDDGAVVAPVQHLRFRSSCSEPNPAPIIGTYAMQMRSMQIHQHRLSMQTRCVRVARAGRSGPTAFSTGGFTMPSVGSLRMRWGIGASRFRQPENDVAPARLPPDAPTRCPLRNQPPRDT